MQHVLIPNHSLVCYGHLLILNSSITTILKFHCDGRDILVIQNLMALGVKFGKKLILRHEFPLIGRQLRFDYLIELGALLRRGPIVVQATLKRLLFL